MLPLHPGALRYYREAGIADEQRRRCALADQMNDEVAKQKMLLRHPKREGLASNFLRVCFRPSAVRRMVALQPIDTSRPCCQAPAKST